MRNITIQWSDTCIVWYLMFVDIIMIALDVLYNNVIYV